MSTTQYVILILKILAARWFRITSRLSTKEVDYIYQACAGEPSLRYVMEDLLKIRR
jgi:hypothetical protein